MQVSGVLADPAWTQSEAHERDPVHGADSGVSVLQGCVEAKSPKRLQGRSFPSL